jgi:phospholipid/cholesterol/gamma-HCH transport system substrate-binding protein
VKAEAMANSSAFETAVGAGVIAVAASFLAYAYTASGQGNGRGAYKLEAVFGKVDGITEGADVRIAGVKVGAVSSRRLDPATYEARLEMRIERGVAVPDDSIAKIVSDGLLGGAFVSIEPGASEDMLADGGVIAQTQGSVDLLGLAVQAFTSGQGRSDSASDGKSDDRTER